MKRIRIPEDVELPLIGCICFGIIDRGTNLLQIRPSSICCLNCIFCSTDLGPNSKRATEYIVDCDYLLEWVREIARFKGNYKLQMHIDFGEPTTYPRLIDLVQGLNEIKGVETISMETKAFLLNEKEIDELKEAGLTRINLSLDAIDKELAKKLTNTPSYDVSRVLELAEYTLYKKIDLLIAPVWIPGLNDEEIPKIIQLAKRLNARLGIQKYETHKFGRKPKRIKPISWWKFYRKLEEWERKFNVNLKIGPKDFGIERRKILPILFKNYQKITVNIKAPGWMKNEMIGIKNKRCITVVNCGAEVGTKIKVRILKNKHNLYIAKPS